MMEYDTTNSQAHRVTLANFWIDFYNKAFDIIEPYNEDFSDIDFYYISNETELDNLNIDGCFLFEEEFEEDGTPLHEIKEFNLVVNIKDHLTVLVKLLAEEGGEKYTIRGHEDKFSFVVESSEIFFKDEQISDEEIEEILMTAILSNNDD